MTAYRCLVVSKEGLSDWRLVEAPNKQSAAAQLVADGFTPVEVRSGPVGLVERLNQPVRLGLKAGIAEQALIMTQLSMLIGSGLPVDRSLDLLREQAPRARMRDRLAQVLSQVRGGASLAQAFERETLVPPYAVGVIRAAEQSGRLGVALTSLAERMTLNASSRSQLATALAYPAAVLVATLLALGLVLTLVVPQFESLFAGQEAKLPVLTQIVLALSRAVRNHGLILLAGVAIAVLLLAILLRSALLARFAQRWREHLPLFRLRDQYLAAQFTGLFATMVGSGVAVVRALPLARDALSSSRWRSHLELVEQQVREGRLLSAALAEEAIVPVTAIRLIEVGERTGQLAQTCSHASQIMGEAARARIERIVALANPLAIIFLGGAVAMLVAGVMLGIFALGDFAG
jgi:general secretion pathway protein F